jgi:hypothetical protein
VTEHSVKTKKICFGNFFLFSLSIFLSGCAGVDSRYPNSWPAIDVTASQCPSIEGSYKTKGPATQLAPEESSFLKSRLGFSDEIALLRNVNIISIAQPDDDSLIIEAKTADGVDRRKIVQPESDSLIIESKTKGAVVGRKNLSSVRGDWHCENGRLFLAEMRIHVSNGTSTYQGNSKFSLGRASNGALIGEETRSMFGVVNLNPVIDSPHFWFMWPKVD